MNAEKGTMVFRSHNPLEEADDQRYNQLIINEDAYDKYKETASLVIERELKNRKSTSFEDMSSKIKAELENANSNGKGMPVDLEPIHYVLASIILDKRLEKKIRTNKK